MLAGFALSVVDCIVLFPAWQNFTTGWLYLGSRLGGEAILSEAPRGRRKNQSRNITERIGRQTLTFLVVRESLAVLPEFAALTAVTEDGYTGMNWYAYITLFREIAIVVSLVLGVIWLARVCRYASRVKRDTAFWTALDQKYETEIQAMPQVFAKRRLYAGTLCIALGGVATVDFHVDGMEILPNVLTAVLFLAGALILRPCVAGKWKAAALWSVVYIPASVAAWIWRWQFETTVGTAAVLRDTEAAQQFSTMCSVTVLSEGLFLAAFGGVLTMLYAVVKGHTGYEAVNPNDLRSKESNRLLHRSLNLRLTWSYIIAALATIGRFLAVVAAPYVAGLQLRFGKVTLPATDSLLYGADFLFHIVVTVMLWTALSAVREETYAKYRLY